MNRPGPRSVVGVVSTRHRTALALPLPLLAAALLDVAGCGAAGEPAGSPPPAAPGGGADLTVDGYRARRGRSCRGRGTSVQPRRKAFRVFRSLIRRSAPFLVVLATSWIGTGGSQLGHPKVSMTWDRYRDRRTVSSEAADALERAHRDPKRDRQKPLSGPYGTSILCLAGL